jgi:hypothetical protein
MRTVPDIQHRIDNENAIKWQHYVSRNPSESVLGRETLHMHLGLIVVHHRTLDGMGWLWRHSEPPCVSTWQCEEGRSWLQPLSNVHRKSQPITDSHSPGAPSASDTCSLAALTSSE